jgi:hypothetical protein
MRASIRRWISVALCVFGLAVVSAPALAQTGQVRISIVKGGWFIGAQAGNGTLTFAGKTYPLAVGGLSAGLVFGGSATDFVGTASNLRRASDIQGVYSAIGAGAAIAGGARAIQMRNANGVVLTLRGKQVGLMANLDLSGMTVTMR